MTEENENLEEEVQPTIPSTGSLSDVPTLDLEDFEIPEDEETAAEDKSGGSLKFGFIGAGQCGGRIAEAFYKLGYTKTFIVNTAEQDMATNTVANKINITPAGYTGGAGKDMNIAAKGLEEHKDTVYNSMRAIFGNVDHIFICAGLGGGSGGGSIDGLIDLAKKYMEYTGAPVPEKQVGVIVTLPSRGEAMSPKVKTNAYEIGYALSALADTGKISPMIIIDNEKAGKLYSSKVVPKQFYPTINNSIATLLHVFNIICTKPSEYLSFDATDFRSVLECGGHMIMGVSTVNKFGDKNAVADALKKNLTKTLLAEDFDLSTALGSAVIVRGAEEVFSTVTGLMEHIGYGFDTIAGFTGNATVHRGIYSDTSLKGRLSVYTLIGGLEMPKARYDKLK